MTLDRHAVERQRFARLLGTHEELGSGLPIGSESSVGQPPSSRSDSEEQSEQVDDH
ncbi:hypothetical protein ACFO5R_18605 [Halosolutus amylolyticus]|uniref:Uncharacterized protein n=1 Tax=Halosolutus amylolyticus TaxID=2932267 RepID=A0ABD5PTN6_9EURY|nr:hypothetical protein [Halosolutus amylolyticus]